MLEFVILRFSLTEPNWDNILDSYYANNIGERLIADSILIDGVMSMIDVGM